MRQEKDRQEEYFLEQMIIVLGGSMHLAKEASSGKENQLEFGMPRPSTGEAQIYFRVQSR